MLEKYKLSPQTMMPWHPGVTISTERAAELLGTSKSTIIRMIEEGSIEAYKLRKNKKNSHYKVIKDSVLRVADEWRKEVALSSASGGAATAAEPPGRSRAH